ncbi:MAG: right-handed parallel beta-helix repeat-containing protein [Pirellulaceae bacterium]
MKSSVFAAIRIGALCWLCISFVCISGLLANTVAADERDVVLHVAVNGNDAHDGSAMNPLQTLTAAQRQVRKLIAKGIDRNIQVVIHAGTYELEQSLVFGPADSMPAGFSTSYQAAKDETVVISGGRVLSNKKGDGQGRWTAKVAAEKSQHEHSSWRSIRQLFQGDDCLIRARSPNQGYFRVASAGPDRRTSLHYDPAEWHPPESIEGVELALLHDWSMSRIRIASADQSKSMIHLANRVGAHHNFFCIDGFEPHPRYFVENSQGFLDSPGEFFFAAESNELKALLTAHRSPELVPLVAPRLAELVRVEGTSAEPVRGIRFIGLQFRHTTCPIPESGYAGIQASFFEKRVVSGETNAQPDLAGESGHSRLPAACTMTFAEDCRWEGCQFQQLGGGGIYLDRQTNRVEIKACSLADIGGCGIMIGETSTRVGEPEQDLTCRGNSVRNCQVKRCGRVLLGSVGIWVGIARETMIQNNELTELPYTGISVGWRWDAEPTGCRDNQVVENHIHHVMQELSDGAGIYTLGLQPGTVLSANRIHDIAINAGRAESNGIFMDEGSSQILVDRNVIDHIAKSPIRFHKAGVNTIRNNRLYVAPGDQPFTFNSTDPNVLIFENNETLDQSQAPRPIEQRR